MPLDRFGGEILKDPHTGELAFGGAPDHIATPKEWQDYLSHITVDIAVEPPPGKWKPKNPQMIKVSLMAAIVDQAGRALVKKGATAPIDFDDQSFVVQEYRAKGMLLVIAQHRINGVEHYVPIPLVLPQEAVTWLRLTGRWRSKDAPGRLAAAAAPGNDLPANAAPNVTRSRRAQKRADGPRRRKARAPRQRQSA